jgi:hypothetical protein
MSELGYIVHFVFFEIWLVLLVFYGTYGRQEMMPVFNRN